MFKKMVGWAKAFYNFYGANFAPKLYEIIKSGYKLEHFKRDAASGLTVAIISLPLALAFAIASGVAPEKGLYTAIVAGFFVSVLGGSRYQIGGPTGAFVIVIFNILQQHEYTGLLMAMLIAGVILIIAGFLRLGTYIKYIPYPVVIGFTSGIAVILFTTQVKDLLGLQIEDIPAEFLPKWRAYMTGIGSFTWASIGVSIICFATIFFIDFKKLKLPAYLISLLVSVIIAAIYMVFSVGIDTIGSKFGALPFFLPKPAIPAFDLELAFKVLPSALTVAFLTGIESLLSATVIDSISGDNHNSNAELVANGVATIASAAFSGLPATGAIARTVANYKAKAYSPVSGIIQSVVLLLFMLFLSPIIKYIPLAALSVILILIAFNMFGFRKFYVILQSSRGDRLTLIVTFLLTMFVDLNAAISIGFMLSSIVFMHRMSMDIEVETDDVDELYKQEYEQSGADISEKLNEKGVMSIRFSGPLFFGVASDITSFFRTVKTPKVLILRMSRVTVIDASGANALVEFFKRLKNEYNTKIILSHIRQQPQRVLFPILKEEKLFKDISNASSFENAIALAKKHIREIEKQEEHQAEILEVEKEEFTNK
ncbi:MAG: STAS domain-containing protein [Lactobacillaceae bacterium]|jgi:SulP family sulfate permease|nr:STAS domain-containing protein [Lactobacillaceae bacterium]